MKNLRKARGINMDMVGDTLDIFIKVVRVREAAQPQVGEILAGTAKLGCQSSVAESPGSLVRFDYCGHKSRSTGGLTSDVRDQAWTFLLRRNKNCSPSTIPVRRAKFEGKRGECVEVAARGIPCRQQGPFAGAAHLGRMKVCLVREVKGDSQMQSHWLCGAPGLAAWLSRCVATHIARA